MTPVLKDIHNPEAISWWPLAPGWYGLIVLGLLLMIVILLLHRWWRKQHTIQSLMQLKLKTIRLSFEQDHNASKAIESMNKLIRQVSLANCSREKVASLSGDRWLAFLDSTLQSEQFSKGPGRLLVEEAFKKQINADLSPLFDLTALWLKKVINQKKAWREHAHV